MLRCQHDAFSNVKHLLCDAVCSHIPLPQAAVFSLVYVRHQQFSRIQHFLSRRRLRLFLKLIDLWLWCRWTVPSSIPVGAFDGNSLFGLLNASIATELAHFPTGPSLDSPFWLYMITWHIGLFTTMLLGQVGVNGRKQGYW